tara:strand:+ start:1406 stop:1975 length:570 start_codon:yes stop_codon:yes gene_type:complete
MINWSESLLRGWDVNHPFWNARELKEVKEFLTNMGLLGSHNIMAEGYSDESISYSEGTILNDYPYAEEMPTFWVELLQECVDTSRSGFNYPLNRAQLSNAKQGYQTAKDTKKAGDLFVASVFEMLEEILYDLGDSLDWSYRIKPWAFKVVEASGDIDSEIDRNDEEVTIGGMSWTIEIDPMGIYKDVEE